MKTHMNLFLAAGAVSLIVAMGTGCDSSEPVASNASENTVSTTSVPTFSEVNQALSLDDADAAVVKAALTEWQRTATSERSRFAKRHGQMDFVAAIAPSLDNDQLTKLVNMLVARREAQREARRDRRGGPHNGPKLDALAEELGLTEAQQTQLETANQEMRAKMKEQAEARRAGTVTREQWRETMNAIREEHHARVAEILTPEQLQKMEALRTERREQRQERRMERREARIEQHSAFLNQALGLSDAQLARVRTALEAHAEAQNAIMQSLTRSTMPMGQPGPHDQMVSAREQLQTQLQNIFTEEQQNRFEILQPLFPHRPGMGM